VGAIRVLSFWPGGSNCRESEENRGDQAPEDPNGTCNTETGECWVLRKGERAEPAHRGQAREQDGLYHAGNIMLNLARLLPHEYNIYSVVHADCQNKTE